MIEDVTRHTFTSLHDQVSFLNLLTFAGIDVDLHLNDSVSDFQLPYQLIYQIQRNQPAGGTKTNKVANLPNSLETIPLTSSWKSMKKNFYIFFQWQENLKQASHFVEYIIAIVSVEDAKKIAVESFEEAQEEIKEYVLSIDTTVPSY